MAVLRLFRLARGLRLFGRAKSLRKIALGLSRALGGLASVGLLLGTAQQTAQAKAKAKAKAERPRRRRQSGVHRFQR